MKRWKMAGSTNEIISNSEYKKRMAVIYNDNREKEIQERAQMRKSRRRAEIGVDLSPQQRVILGVLSSVLVCKSNY